MLKIFVSIALIAVTALPCASWAGPSNLIIASEGAKKREHERERHETIEGARMRVMLTLVYRAQENDSLGYRILALDSLKLLALLDRDPSRDELCRSDERVGTERRFGQVTRALAGSPGTASQRLKSAQEELSAQFRALDDYCSGRWNYLRGHVPSFDDVIESIADAGPAALSASIYTVDAELSGWRISDVDTSEKPSMHAVYVSHEDPAPLPQRKTD